MGAGRGGNFGNTQGKTKLIRDKIESLPKNPNTLKNKGWKETTHSQMLIKTSSRTFTDKDTGLKIRFDKGKKDIGGYGAKDHYHVLNPNSTGKHNYYLDRDGNPVPKNSKNHTYYHNGGIIYDYSRIYARL